MGGEGLSAKPLHPEPGWECFWGWRWGALLRRSLWARVRPVIQGNSEEVSVKAERSYQGVLKIMGEL